MAGAELGTAFISVSLNTGNNLSREIKQQFSGIDTIGADSGQKASQGFIGAMGPALKAGLAGIAAGAVVAVGSFVTDAIKDAGALQQSVGAVKTVFKGSSGVMEKFASDAAQSVGLSKDSYNGLASTLGSLLKNGGTPIDQLAGKTNGLITLGADLSSMFGGSTTEAVEALSSAFKGEFDPMERFGVSLSQSAIDAKAASMGYSKVGDSFDATAKQAATMAIIMGQTGDAQGNFAKESSSLEGVNQRIGASMENISAKVGDVFLPVISDALGFINTNVLPGFGLFADALGNGGLGKAFTDLFPGMQSVIDDALPRLGDAFGGLMTALKPVGDWIGTWFPQVLGALGNTVAPIFDTIVGAISNAFDIIGSVFETATSLLTGNWDGFWNGMGGIISGAWNLITGLVKGAFTIVLGLFGVKLDQAAGIWDGFWSGVGGFLAGAWGGILSTVRGGFDSVIGFFRNLPGTITGMLSGAGNWLVGIGQNIIQGLIDGIGSMMGAIGRAILNIVPEAIRGPFEQALGIHSPSRVFMGYGVNIGEGLIKGTEKMIPKITSTMEGLVSLPVMPTVGANFRSDPGTETAVLGSGFSGTTQNIKFDLQPMDPDATASAVARRMSMMLV